jgi:hypothetical protein
MPAADVWIIAMLGALAGGQSAGEAIETANDVQDAYTLKFLRPKKSANGKAKAPGAGMANSV